MRLSAHDNNCQQGQRRSQRLWLWCLLGTMLVTLPGCSGCWRARKTPKKTAAEKAKEEEKEKLLPPFQSPKLLILPYDDGTPFPRSVKLGHWHSGVTAWKANTADFSGNLRTAVVQNRGQLINVYRTPYQLQGSRPIGLPKGQTKRIETLFYVPHSFTAEQNAFGSLSGNTRLQLREELRTRRSDALVFSPGSQTLQEMAAHEFQMVVLAREPDSYGYLKTLESTRTRSASIDDVNAQARTFYRVLLPKIDGGYTPLPVNSLAWTSISVVVWDDVDPTWLSPSQQSALLDWLHWGGQLMVSAPASIDLLRNSFLDPYLPISAEEAVTLDESALAQINETYVLDEMTRSRPSKLLQPPLEGRRLVLRSQAECRFVPETGELLAERRVGRGRVIVSSFRLSSRQFVAWDALDGFFNACLLRNPAREFSEVDDNAPVNPRINRLPPIQFPPNQLGDVSDDEVEEFEFSSEFDGVAMNWANSRLAFREPRIVSKLRYLSRDLGGGGVNSSSASVSEPSTAIVPGEIGDSVTVGFGEEAVFSRDPARESNDQSAPVTVIAVDPDAVDSYGGFARSRGGVAAWNDESAISRAARNSLKAAAGIEVPDASFVLMVLSVYLVVLVPLNWFIFRSIGRVEWAWFAAPVIATIGTIGVVRVAQLDIGFARSRTEIGVLEIQGGYDRAHLTRYAALYTSLGTQYEINCDDPNSLVMPFSSGNQSQLETNSTVTFRQDQTAQLQGMMIPSNDTKMVHCEQMHNLGGSIRLEGDNTKGWKVVNDTDLDLEGVGLMRRRQATGIVEVAWLGSLNSKTSGGIRFLRPTEDGLFPQWEDEPTTARRESDGQLNLRSLLNITSSLPTLELGQVRMFGWTSEKIAGMETKPAAAQASFCTLVVAHLQYAHSADPQIDVNTRAAISSKVKADEEKTNDELLEAAEKAMDEVIVPNADGL